MIRFESLFESVLWQETAARQGVTIADDVTHAFRVRSNQPHRIAEIDCHVCGTETGEFHKAGCYNPEGRQPSLRPLT
jgi:hypothetical protein